MLAAVPVRLYLSSLDIAHIISLMKTQLITYVPVCWICSVSYRHRPEPAPSTHCSLAFLPEDDALRPSLLHTPCKARSIELWNEECNTTALGNILVDIPGTSIIF